MVVLNRYTMTADGEQVEEGRVVGVLVEHGRASVSTIQHMVGHWSTRNDKQKKTTVRQTGVRRQEKVTVSFLLAHLYDGRLFRGQSELGFLV